MDQDNNLANKILKLPHRAIRFMQNKLLNSMGMSKKIEVYTKQFELLSQANEKWEQQHQASLTTIKNLYDENSRWQEQHHLSSVEIAYLKSRHEDEISKMHAGFKQQGNQQAGDTNLEYFELKDELSFQHDLNEAYLKTIDLLAQAQHDFLHKKEFQQITLPLISVIMPVWNRENTIRSAIESVLSQTYSHWELIIIDDGSTDKTKDIIQSYLHDKRIHYIYQEHAGVGVARNAALAISQGNYIAYLDSDNRWYHFTLSLIFYAFLSDSTCKAINFAAVWHNHLNNKKFIHFPEKFDHASIIQGNKHSMRGIELNCFAHHRDLYQQFGGFDTDLTRLIDYDLTYRFSKHIEIKPLPFLGTEYHYCNAKNAISSIKNSWYNLYKIRNKHLPQTTKQDLRLLYISDHFPQVTESYIYSEIDYMQRQGIQVEVWSENPPRTPFPTSVTVHNNSLVEAIQKSTPDIIHAHWLSSLNALDVVKQFNLPVTIRCHGFEFTESLLKKVHAHPSIHSIYLFPHYFIQYAKQFQKVKEIVTAFNPNRYYPQKEKNKKMVLRVSAGIPMKNLHLFFHIAKRCKHHQFVLVIGHSQYLDRYHYVEELIEFNQSLGNPVDVRVDMMPDDIAPLVQEAGIYLHTVSLPGDNEVWSPIGMPMSISESMATGAYLLARYCGPYKQYIKDAGDFYTTEDEACELINASLNWSDDEWALRQKKSIDRAYQYFVDDLVLPTIVADWENIKASQLKACA